MDNRRTFIEQMGDNLIKLLDISQITDFMVCLNDDMIAVKAIYIIIEVIKNFKTKKTFIS